MNCKKLDTEILKGFSVRCNDVFQLLIPERNFRLNKNIAVGIFRFLYEMECKSVEKLFFSNLCKYNFTKEERMRKVLLAASRVQINVQIFILFGIIHS